MRGGVLVLLLAAGVVGAACEPYVEVEVRVPPLTQAMSTDAHARSTTLSLRELWDGRRWCPPFSVEGVDAHVCALRSVPGGLDGVSALQLATQARPGSHLAQLAARVSERAERMRSALFDVDGEK